MTTTNRLALETSPYLRQHADNPVNWYPWGEEAFAAARERNVPILLSVGYSACHWCHVMAHESFEDVATAAVINELTVPVKVDREERPDVDAIYMEAVQAVAGSGGWPMTVFLLPDGKPFFGGTYFPRDRFVELLRRIDDAWRTNRGGLEADASQLAEAVVRGTALPSRGWAAGDDVSGGADLVASTAAALRARLDHEWGGFGSAPKFPQPGMLELLLQAWGAGGDPGVLEAATLTLDAMACGGIYDHLGGGFARYATDRRWLVPHFEKMLYDNALLARVYLHAWQATGADRYRQVATETIGYLLSAPIRQQGAGFSCAEDADSEGVEGKFYVWSLGELTDVGGSEAAAWYGATPEGNWEGTNILWRPVRGDLARPSDVEASRLALLAARSQRTRPALDDKVLTEWNAMAVATLAEAGAVLDRPDWVGAAVEVAEFLLASLRRGDGRWMRSWQAGTRSRHLAYGADYAWLVEAFTRLAEATGQARWIAEARDAADRLVDLFWDEAEGGFHTTGGDAEALIARPKDSYDGAIPSTNSVATSTMLRLAALTGVEAYRLVADRVLEVMGPAMVKVPIAFTGLVSAAGLSEGTVEVAVSGSRPDLVAAARAPYRPERVLAWGEPYDSPLWEGRTGRGQEGLAFVCRNYTCSAPTGDAATVRAALGNR